MGDLLMLFSMHINAICSTHMITCRYEPAHEILVLIACVASEYLDGPEHPRSLVRAFTTRIHPVLRGLDQNLNLKPLYIDTHARSMSAYTYAIRIQNIFF